MKNVHTEHCCIYHGCKYYNGDDACCVANGSLKQSFRCESCWNEGWAEVKDENQMLVMAIQLAVNAHGMQLDKAGKPYILHPLHVMDTMRETIEKIVAVLHDVVEDTGVTLGQLWCMGFSQEVIDAVDAMTKRKHEKLEDYWIRAASNKLAARVKLKDIDHNSSDERLAQLPDQSEREYLRNKYARARKFIMDHMAF